MVIILIFMKWKIEMLVCLILRDMCKPYKESLMHVHICQVYRKDHQYQSKRGKPRDLLYGRIHTYFWRLERSEYKWLTSRFEEFTTDFQAHIQCAIFCDMAIHDQCKYTHAVHLRILCPMLQLALRINRR